MLAIISKRTGLVLKYSPVGLRADFIRNRRENSTVTLQEFRAVRIASVEVESSILGLQERKKATSDKCLSIKRDAKMVRIVSTRRHISDPKESTESVIVKAVSSDKI